MKMNLKLSAAALFLLLLSTTSAQAQTVFKVALDRYAPVTIYSSVTGDIVSFSSSLDSSYCCSIEASAANAGARFTALHGRPGSLLTFAERGSSQPTVLYNGTHSDSEAARACFIIDNSSVFISGVTLELAFDSASPVDAEVNCIDTTLHGGFNTSVTDFNFLELTNTSGVEITARLKGANSVTGNLFAINDVIVTVPAGGRTDVDIHTLVGPGAYGPLRVKHNGAPGSLRAVLSQYNITSASPLDFTPVAQLEFKTRKSLEGGN